MPTYEYLCPVCGSFEVYQGIKDSALNACPTCGGPVKRKIGTGGGLLFKGSGFYATDYRSSDYRKEAKSDQAAPKAEPKTEGGASSAPAAPAGGTTAPSAGGPGPSSPPSGDKPSAGGKSS